jgi:hypothetical protein
MSGGSAILTAWWYLQPIRRTARDLQVVLAIKNLAIRRWLHRNVADAL